MVSILIIHQTKSLFLNKNQGKIKVSKHKYASSVEYDIPNGKLIGIDMGEFGGWIILQEQKDLTKIFYVHQKNGKDIKPRWFGSLMTNETDPIRESP